MSCTIECTTVIYPLSQSIDGDVQLGPELLDGGDTLVFFDGERLGTIRPYWLPGSSNAHTSTRRAAASRAGLADKVMV